MAKNVHEAHLSDWAHLIHDFLEYAFVLGLLIIFAVIMGAI